MAKLATALEASSFPGCQGPLEVIGASPSLKATMPGPTRPGGSRVSIFLIALLERGTQTPLEVPPVCVPEPQSQEVLPDALPKSLFLPFLLLKVVSKLLVIGIG